MLAVAEPARADTVGLPVYLERVREACALVRTARDAPPPARAAAVDRARDALTRADSVRLGETTVRGPGPVIAAHLAVDDSSLDRAGAECARLLASVEALARPAAPGDAAADARLADALRGAPRAAGPPSLGLPLEVIAAAILGWVGSLGLPLPELPPLTSVLVVIAAVGAVVIAVLVAVLGGGLRERVRREIVLPEGATAPDARPALLREADAALARGDGRSAVHALYRYAIAALAAQGSIRFERSLTDGELLVRAAGAPHLAELRSLVRLHERVWFGLRKSGPEDAALARRLAEEIAR